MLLIFCVINKTRGGGGVGGPLLKAVFAESSLSHGSTVEQAFHKDSPTNSDVQSS